MSPLSSHSLSRKQRKTLYLILTGISTNVSMFSTSEYVIYMLEKLLPTEKRRGKAEIN